MSVGINATGLCLCMLVSFFSSHIKPCLFLPMYFPGGVHRLESVEEYNELMVRNGDPRARMLEVSRDGRKHSLPQLLESSGSQVASAMEPLAFSCSHSWPVGVGEHASTPDSLGFLLSFQRQARAAVFWRTARLCGPGVFGTRDITQGVRLEGSQSNIWEQWMKSIPCWILTL